MSECPKCEVGDIVEFAYESDMMIPGRPTEVARVAESEDFGFRPEGYHAFKCFDLMGVFVNHTKLIAEQKAEIETLNEALEGEANLKVYHRKQSEERCAEIEELKRELDEVTKQRDYLEKWAAEETKRSEA